MATPQSINAAVIMLYNMGELASYDEENSILNIERAKLYTKFLADYELPYALALPIFSWSVVFRNQKIVHLNKEISLQDLTDTICFYPESSNRFRCKKSFFLHGDYLMEADMIRYESAEFKKVKEIVKLNPT